MKNSSKIFLLTAIGTAAITFCLIRRAAADKRLATIADEGYETAADILYPGKKEGKKLRYGPVLPGDE